METFGALASIFLPIVSLLAREAFPSDEDMLWAMFSRCRRHHSPR